MNIKDVIINKALVEYGIKGFEYGLAKGNQINCDSYKDYPYYEEKTAFAEKEYIKAQNHLKLLLGIEE